jgi:hypothetical protein
MGGERSDRLGESFPSFSQNPKLKGKNTKDYDIMEVSECEAKALEPPHYRKHPTNRAELASALFQR